MFLRFACEIQTRFLGSWTWEENVACFMINIYTDFFQRSQVRAPARAPLVDFGGLTLNHQVFYKPRMISPYVSTCFKTSFYFKIYKLTVLSASNSVERLFLQVTTFSTYVILYITVCFTSQILKTVRERLSFSTGVGSVVEVLTRKNPKRLKLFKRAVVRKSCVSS